MPLNKDGSSLPERVDHYRIKDKLGEGGMGVVYAAEDERLGRTVALKMLREATGDRSARERLRREARVAASISHPNVCRLYEVGEHQGELFLAMELLEGESLAARIVRGPLPLSDALPIMLSILDALDALHTQGVIHRDLKPSNVFLASVGIKLLDFGLAQRAETYVDRTETQLSLAGMLVGTPRYMAPERLQGRASDARADVFAAGAVLFELLIGKPVFDGATIMEVMHAVIYEQTPVLGGSPAIAAADRIIHRAMAKNPDERYSSARAMADDIRSALQLTDSGEMIRARPMTRLIVLPFRILRSDPETDFLAFSLADAITISLSGLESLLVRSTLTAARFGGDTPDLRALAGQADVDIVLTGTLLRAGDQLRVNAQLIEAPGGAVLWSLTSQVPLGDVFQLQDALAQRIVGSLELPLSARDQRLLKHDVPATAKAYEFYLRANKLGYDPKQWAVTRDLYLQCLEEDPSYAPAWARLGRICRVLGMYTERDSQELFRQAESAFKRALELNPQLPLAHNLYTYLEVELGGAREAMLRLLERAQGCAGDPELFA
ncbi:MAG TPA: FlgO family outer membrane protein, partial [Gemmatimonadales bacterium]|nr:FlgO family outer membrane protein [Gemmatimonadales bacterium]